MSEEEILNIMNKLGNIYDELKKDDEEGHSSAYEMQFEDFEAIQGLLDLYNKEKKKSKILELAKIPYLEGEIMAYKEFFVSKDKIRKRIKELEEFRDENEKTKFIVSLSFYNSIDNEIYDLKELLEEE